MPAACSDLASPPLAGASLHALSRLGRRLRQVPDAGWSPPPLPELIARIDLALDARRAG